VSKVLPILSLSSDANIQQNNIQSVTIVVRREFDRWRFGETTGPSSLFIHDIQRKFPVTWPPKSRSN